MIRSKQTFVTLGLLSELGEIDRVFAGFRHLKESREQREL
jgi:hypothetical protein